MRTGTPSARPFSWGSRDQNGRPCITLTKGCTKRSSVRNLEENKKAKALRCLNGARDKGIDVSHVGHAKKIQARSKVKLDLWAIHLKSPTAALATALEGLEQSEGVSSVTSEWRSQKF